jgi:NTP pyrophosphatase (non-canonical NTP hydrolase)
MDYFQKLKLITKALNQKFESKGDDPFQIITRLCEEAGELAKEVNHFENSGVKVEKHGLPDKVKLAKELQDVCRCAWQIALYYDVENEFIASIDDSFCKLKNDGLIVDNE